MELKELILKHYIKSDNEIRNGLYSDIFQNKKIEFIMPVEPIGMSMSLYYKTNNSGLIIKDLDGKELGFVYKIDGVIHFSIIPTTNKLVLSNIANALVSDVQDELVYLLATLDIKVNKLYLENKEVAYHIVNSGYIFSSKPYNNINSIKIGSSIVPVKESILIKKDNKIPKVSQLEIFINHKNILFIKDGIVFALRANKKIDFYNLEYFPADFINISNIEYFEDDNIIYTHLGNIFFLAIDFKNKKYRQILLDSPQNLTKEEIVKLFIYNSFKKEDN